MAQESTMTTEKSTPHDTPSTADTELRALYRQLVDAWNRRNADAYAHLFAEDGAVVGFDGSEMTGSAEIAATLRKIFTDHATGVYRGKIRGVRMLAPDVGLLRAIAGIVPAGQTDLDPKLNSVQSLVAIRHDEQWRIVLFHNTPAQLHGRPEMVEQMTEELRREA